MVLLYNEASNMLKKGLQLFWGRVPQSSQEKSPHGKICCYNLVLKLKLKKKGSTSPLSPQVTLEASGSVTPCMKS